MKRKKTTLLVSLSAVVIVLAVIGTANWSNIRRMIAPQSSVKLSYYASSLDDLITDSPLIVEAKVTDKNTDITYLGVNFVTTKIDITKILKGDISDHEITLLQTDCKEDPIVEKGSSVLLFLDKYDGPITTNAYVCQGLYQGQYKIDGTTILPSKADGNENLANEIKNMKTGDQLKNKIDSMK